MELKASYFPHSLLPPKQGPWVRTRSLYWYWFLKRIIMSNLFYFLFTGSHHVSPFPLSSCIFWIISTAFQLVYLHSHVCSINELIIERMSKFQYPVETVTSHLEINCYSMIWDQRIFWCLIRYYVSLRIPFLDWWMDFSLITSHSITVWDIGIEIAIVLGWGHSVLVQNPPLGSFRIQCIGSQRVGLYWRNLAHTLIMPS